MTNTQKITTGILVGVCIGGVAGLLLAPERGAKTRGDLANKIKDAKKAVTKTYKRAKRLVNSTNLTDKVGKTFT